MTIGKIGRMTPSIVQKISSRFNHRVGATESAIRFIRAEAGDSLIEGFIVCGADGLGAR
jgi:hypothetical protein